MDWSKKLLNLIEMRQKSPPQFAQWIISHLSSFEEEHALTDAIDIEYFDIQDRYGVVISWIWYWSCTVGAVFQYIKFSLLWILSC